MNIKSNPIITIFATILVSIIAILIILSFSAFSLLLSGILVLLAGSEIAILYFIKRKVIKRKQNIFTQISIVFMGVALIVGAIDIMNGTFLLPGWTVALGLLLLFSGNYLAITSLFADPRHGLEEYGETPSEEKGVFGTHGPYDVVRHPMNLAGFLLAISIPLFLGSAYAFIPALFAIIAIIVQAVVVENYRFENYTWYYDYTKKVPYMIFPVIW